MCKNLKIKSNVSWGRICDEVFIFDEINGNIYVLKGIESELWDIVINNNNTENILVRLDQRCSSINGNTYGVLNRLITSLCKKNIIEVTECET